MDDAAVIEAYNAGEDADSIAFRAGISAYYVLKTVREAGHPIRKPGTAKRKTLKLTDAEIARRYAAGEAGTALAAEAGCASRTLYKIVREQGGIVRPPCSHNRGSLKRMSTERRTFGGQLRQEQRRRQKDTPDDA